MRDLLVVVPTRGRPGNAIRLLEAVAATATGQTDVIFGLDDDDPAAGSLTHREVMWEIGPRKGMAEWTNILTLPRVGDYRAFASFGDDHLPRTPGWDRVLLEALDGMGGTGIAYGDDLIMRERLCTAPVVSADIVVALGWLCAPGLSHMCVDNVLKDIGEGAGCLAYRPDVVVEHLHWCAGKAAVDETYSEAGIFSTDHPDWHAYKEWQKVRMTQDIEVVKGLL